MLDFGALPPEINSGRMYSGPGSGPMVAAATAWDALASELSSAAAGFGSVIAELTGGQWLGPASVSMVRAAAPYLAWLHDTAAQADQAAAQAKLAAAAYELAFVMTVPPPVIATNRSLLMALVATNFFGQNTPAIAMTEAHYTEMWIQDAAAMYGYAGSSATASRLTPFTRPQSAAASSDPPSASTALSVGLSATKFVNAAVSSSSAATSGHGIFIADERLAFQAARDLDSPPGPGGVLASAAPFRLGGPDISAAMGRASPVGSLSAPPSWAAAAPEIRPVALASPDSGGGVAAASGDAPAVPGNAFSQTVLGTLSRNGFDARHPKSRPIIVRSPAAG